MVKNKAKTNKDVKAYNMTKDNGREENKKDDSLLLPNKSIKQKEVLGFGNSKLLRIVTLNFLSFHVRNRSQIVKYLETSFNKILTNSYFLFKDLEEKKLIEDLTPNLRYGKFFRITALGKEILEKQPKL